MNQEVSRVEVEVKALMTNQKLRAKQTRLVKIKAPGRGSTRNFIIVQNGR